MSAGSAALHCRPYRRNALSSVVVGVLVRSHAAARWMCDVNSVGSRGEAYACRVRIAVAVAVKSLDSIGVLADP